MIIISPPPYPQKSRNLETIQQLIELQMQGQANGIIRMGSYLANRSEVLGKGATGYVYKGMNVDTNQSIAVKAIEMSQVNNEVTQYLLEGQKKALVSIDSPQVVKVYDIVQEKQFCYIVMEECRHGTLKDYISEKGKLTEDQAIEIFHKIVKGYTSIIEKLFIHRDLKPTNIMMRGLEDPVIIDFGYCEMIMGKRPLIQYNVGSPSYMSPQAYGKSRYSEKSDIWALGVILYEMLTGKTLDTGKNIKQYFKEIQETGRVSYDSSDLSDVCKELLELSLTVDADARATIHKLKYVIDKSMIPKMKAKLNKKYSEHVSQASQASHGSDRCLEMLNFKVPQLNGGNIGNYSSNSHKELLQSDRKNNTVNFVPRMEENDYSPLRAPTLIHHTHSMSNHRHPHTEKKIEHMNYSSQPHPQNIAPQHHPHVLLRRTLDKNSMAPKNRKIIPFPMPIQGRIPTLKKVQSFNGPYLIQKQQQPKDNGSLRII